MSTTFHGNTLVTGGNFSIVQNARRGFEILHQHIASEAFHDSGECFDLPKCHQDTRIAIRQQISDWVEEFDLSSQILWLYGDAGAGKSSIAQAIAEELYSRQRLIASFFFSRTAPGRSDAKRLIPSLSYQLALSIPESRAYIEAAVDEDPAIFNKALQFQAQKLIVEPMSGALASLEAQSDKQAPLPRLIIIDGLNECHGPRSQQDIINTLASALRGHRLPTCILITSRPEGHIRNSFDSTSLTPMMIRIGLNDQYNAEADIRLYLRDTLGNLKDSHPLRIYIPSLWPTEEDIETIVRQSSGQFIYAATVARYTQSPQHKPHERLSIVLGLPLVVSEGHEPPFGELDNLYAHIFSAVEAPSVVLKILFMVLELRTLAMSVGRLCGIECKPEYPRVIEAILSLRPGDVQMFLLPLASIIRYQGDEKPLRVQHASLRDFLLDFKRSKHFSINLGKMHAEFSRIFLHNILTPDDHINEGALRYTFMLFDAASPDPDLIKEFCCLNLLQICDAMYNDRRKIGSNFFHLDYMVMLHVGTFLSDFFSLIQCSPVFLEQRDQIYHHHRGNLDRFFQQYFHKYSSNAHLIDLPAFVCCAQLFDYPPGVLPFHVLRRILNLDLEMEKIDDETFSIATYFPRAIDDDSLYFTELRSFLLDQGRSKEHFVGGNEYARAALQCLRYITNTNVHGLSQSGGKLARRSLGAYSLAFRYLAVMLGRSAYNGALVQALPKFIADDTTNLFPDDFQSEFQDAKLATEIYLKVHNGSSSRLSRLVSGVRKLSKTKSTETS